MISKVERMIELKSEIKRAEDSITRLTGSQIINGMDEYIDYCIGEMYKDLEELQAWFDNRYPIELPPRKYYGPEGLIVRARTYHTDWGWELWGVTVSGGEVHLDTQKVKPQEWA